jgi:hypothetical protein
MLANRSSWHAHVTSFFEPNYLYIHPHAFFFFFLFFFFT